jgi:hypothetical protein
MALDTAEHAPELAGLIGVVAALLPWSVSFSADAFSGFLAFRFVFGAVRFDFGSRAADVEWTVISVTEIGAFYGGDLSRMATLWFIAAALFILVLLLGFALLASGEHLAVGVLDPVRLMGGLCLCMALLLSGATWLLWQHTPRLPIPVGVVVLYFVGARLLTIDRTQETPPVSETSG